MKLKCHNLNCESPEKDEEEFSWRIKNKGIRQNDCRSCRSRTRKDPLYKAERNASIAKDKILNPIKYKKLNLSKKGVTKQVYDDLFEKQGGKCAVCGTESPGKSRHSEKDRSFAIDHDHNCCPTHKTCGNCIRGLLCSNCNSAAGLLKDDPEIVFKLSQYLFDTKWKLAHENFKLRNIVDYHAGF